MDSCTVRSFAVFLSRARFFRTCSHSFTDLVCRERCKRRERGWSWWCVRLFHGRTDHQQPRVLRQVCGTAGSIQCSECSGDIDWWRWRQLSDVSHRSQHHRTRLLLWLQRHTADCSLGLLNSLLPVAVGRKSVIPSFYLLLTCYSSRLCNGLVCANVPLRNSLSHSLTQWWRKGRDGGGNIAYVFTSAKEVMFLPVFVCLFVCLSVCLLAR